MDQRKIIKNIKVVAPKPIIKYNNDGFRPYAKMSDLFKSQAGKVEYFELSYKDNPDIYDQETGELTKIGKRRVSRLQNLEGLRYKRG